MHRAGARVCVRCCTGSYAQQSLTAPLHINNIDFAYFCTTQVLTLPCSDSSPTLRCGAAQVNVALTGLPRFRCLNPCPALTPALP